MRRVRLSIASFALLTPLAAGATGPGATAAGEPAPVPAVVPAQQRSAGQQADAPAAPAAPQDPLERLRQRLAERLGAAQAGPDASPYDLRVATRTAVAAPGAGKRGTAGAGPASRKPAGEPAAWAYEGAGGPQAWGALKPEYALCANGQRQSPIDIQGGLAVDLEPVRFDYRASGFGVVDNGHTVQVNVAPGNAIELGGRRFELQQFHFHRPAEERIDGRAFEMSLHLVHKDEQGRLAVVALLIDRGPAQPVVQQVWNHLPLERHQETAPRVALDLQQLLPADRRYYTYMGSLTTPPCSEGVQWVVMRHPVTLAPEQIDLFARIYPMNARPVQAASGRRILQSE
jgi:carbonic anhydrase